MVPRKTGWNNESDNEEMFDQVVCSMFRFQAGNSGLPNRTPKYLVCVPQWGLVNDCLTKNLLDGVAVSILTAKVDLLQPFSRSAKFLSLLARQVPWPLRLHAHTAVVSIDSASPTPSLEQNSSVNVDACCRYRTPVE